MTLDMNCWCYVRMLCTTYCLYHYLIARLVVHSCRTSCTFHVWSVCLWYLLKVVKDLVPLCCDLYEFNLYFAVLTDFNRYWNVYVISLILLLLVAFAFANVISSLDFLSSIYFVLNIVYQRFGSTVCSVPFESPSFTFFECFVSNIFDCHFFVVSEVWDLHFLSLISELVFWWFVNILYFYFHLNKKHIYF